MTDNLKLSDRYPRFREYYVAAQKKEVPVRKRWTADEDVRLYELMADGVSYADIGKELDRSPKSVEMRAFTLRRKMRAAGMKGQSTVMTKRKPAKRKPTKRKASVKKAPKKRAPKKEAPEPEIVYSGGAMFEERIGHMMLLGAAGAAGVWLVLILLTIGLIQNL